jgi:hypothetical protein
MITTVKFAYEEVAEIKHLTHLQMSNLAYQIGAKRLGKEPMHFVEIKVDLYLIRVIFDGNIAYESNPQSIIQDAKTYGVLLVE